MIMDIVLMLYCLLSLLLITVSEKMKHRGLLLVLLGLFLHR